MRFIHSLVPALLLIFISGCTSTAPVRRKMYATMKTSRVFNYEFSRVWKNVENVVSRYKITRRDPSKASRKEMSKLRKRDLETDWIYGRSKDKYVLYRVDGVPKKKYLQVRYKYEISVRRRPVGTEVAVRTQEEIQKLDQDGISQGYEGVTNIDTSRSNDLLERVRISLLAARN